VFIVLNYHSGALEPEMRYHFAMQLVETQPTERKSTGSLGELFGPCLWRRLLPNLLKTHTGCLTEYDRVRTRNPSGFNPRE